METLPPAGKFHFHQSVFLMGMMTVYEVTEKKEYLDYIQAYFDLLIDKQGNVVFERDQLDSLQVRFLLFKLYELTHDNKYLLASHKLRATLDTINRTSENGFWHKDAYPYQMWLDGLFMAGPFLVKYGKQFNQLELIQQVLYHEYLMRKHMHDKKQAYFNMLGMKRKFSLGQILKQGVLRNFGGAQMAGWEQL